MMAGMTEQEIQNFLQTAALQQQANALQQLAMRPQKNYQKTTGTAYSTPYALADMIRARDTIGDATNSLSDILKARETPLYATLKALGQVKGSSEPGKWLESGLRGLSSGYTSLDDIKAENEQVLYNARMEDLAQRLAYDKSMGDIQQQEQEQHMDYIPVPVPKGSGKNEEVPQVRNYDISPVEMPEKKQEWGEREIQAIGRIDSQMGVRTPLGMLANKAADYYNPEGKLALRANLNAYTDRFTVDRISRIAKATGGNRGIDTMPEVNLKGGPELSAMNMNSKEYAKAVQDQAYSAADQIIKANPNATITREELANAFINDYNHGLQKEYRIVELLPVSNQQDSTVQKKNVVSRYTNQPIKRPVNNTIVIGEVRNGVRFLGYNPDGSMKFEKVTQ